MHNIMESMDLATLCSFSVLNHRFNKEVAPVLWKHVAFKPRLLDARDPAEFARFCKFITEDGIRARYIRSLYLELCSAYPASVEPIDTTKKDIVTTLNHCTNLIRLSINIFPYRPPINFVVDLLNTHHFPFRLRIFELGTDRKIPVQFFERQPHIQEITLVRWVGHGTLPRYILPNLSRVSGSLEDIIEQVPGRPVSSVKIKQDGYSMRQAITLPEFHIAASVLQQSTADILHLNLSLREEFIPSLSILAASTLRLWCLEVCMHFDITRGLHPSELFGLVRMTVDVVGSLSELETVVWTGYQPIVWEFEFVRLTEQSEMVCPSLRTAIFSGGDHSGSYERADCRTPWTRVESTKRYPSWGDYS